MKLDWIKMPGDDSETYQEWILRLPICNLIIICNDYPKDETVYYWRLDMDHSIIINYTELTQGQAITLELAQQEAVKVITKALRSLKDTMGILLDE